MTIPHTLYVDPCSQGGYAWRFCEDVDYEPDGSIIGCVQAFFASNHLANTVVVVYRGSTALRTCRGEIENCPEDADDRLQAFLDRNK